jgi:crotonobetainyl-CoA:carnitine CoA-transferase CaiB-like acyl-CoA transferase
MTGACDGVSVLDLGLGMAGAMAGLVLADNGADVVKVEPPQGDWARADRGFLMWNRNKRSVVLDLKDARERDRLLGLARGADVLIESFRPGVADRLGIGWAAMRAQNPRLVYCSISGFGPANGYADVAGYEGLVSAAIGRMVGLDPLNGAVAGQDRDAPIFTAAPIASYGAAQLAVQGILAALRARARHGHGDHVTTSLVQGAAAFMMRQELPRGDVPRTQLVSPVTNAGIELCFMTARCSDGRYLQMCARQDAHFRDWVTAIGLGHLLNDPRFAGAPLGMRRIEDVHELDRLIRDRMTTRTSNEWMSVFTSDYDVGCDPFLTPAEFLEHPQLVENGRVVEVGGPEAGSSRQIGPLVNLSDTPSAPGRRPVPRLGAHTAEVLATPRAPRAPGAGAPTRRPPLEDVTILEIAHFVAGPAASTMLAELGARVVKIEPIGGDPFRRTGLQAAKFMHGKESVAVDLKTAEGVAIVHELARRADVFVHSFRPGVPERLCVDHPTLAALNPELIYLYAGSYGSRGPQAKRAAFHSTPNALSGGGIIQAGAGNPPVDDSFPDPGSALGAATAIMLGLSARERTGRGQAMETTMLASAGYIMSPWLVAAEWLPEPPMVDKGQHGLGALYRLYRCSDGWLFVACVQDAEWRAFAEASGHAEWLADPRFVTAGARRTHDAELATAIATVLAQRGAHGWEQLFRGHGVPAVRAFEQVQDVWFEEQGLLCEASHPVFGEYWRPPVKVTLDSAPARLGPAAAVGEHTRPVLAELGYSDADVDRLCRAGVVACWTEEPVAAGAGGDQT